MIFTSFPSAFRSAAMLSRFWVEEVMGVWFGMFKFYSTNGGNEPPETLRDSEVTGEDEPILLTVVVTLQVLPGCLPIHLYESREVDSIAVLGDLLGELCPAHLTLIRIGEILQGTITEALNERTDGVGVVVLQQFLQGFQFFGILILCE